MSLLPSQWPDKLPNIGERGVCALTLCGCQREHTFAAYGGQPYCQSCARYIAWGLQPEPSQEAGRKSDDSPRSAPAADPEVEW